MRYSGLLTLCITSLLLLRCAREVIIDLPEEEPRVVAVCHFTEDQHFRAYITMSQPVNEGDDPEQPTDVDATLSIDGAYYDLLYREKGDGDKYYWRSHQQKLPRTSVEYSFVVRVPGYPTVQSSSSIPIHRPIAPIKLKQGEAVLATLSDGSKELRIPLELHLQEAPGEEPYFAFYISDETEVSESSDPSDIYTIQRPTNFLADGRTISLLHNIPEPVVLINENYWADGRQTLYLTARIPVKLGTERPRTLYITWRTLSKEFYRYHLSLSRQSSNLPLSEPDAVYNNMIGGLGNFSGYSARVDTVDIPDF